MSLRQILILAVALIAAIGALLLVRNMSAPAVQTVAPATGPMVLVAAKDIPTGSAAQPDMLAWVAWPEGALNATFVTQTANPKALEEYVGAIARIDILAGEPVTDGRLVKKGNQGFFAAMIEPGYRAVALPISRETAAAGFIMPGDRVDVILSRELDAGAGGRGGDKEVRSDVILENVKVLSIGEAVRPADGEPKPMEGAVATLELSPRDSETFALARKMGDVTLALRSVQADAGRLDSARRPGVRVLDQGPPPTSEVRVHAFGAVTSTPVDGGGRP